MLSESESNIEQFDENANQRRKKKKNEYAIHVKHKSDTEIVYLPRSLDIHDFIKAAFSKLNISTRHYTKVKLRDNLNTVLTPHNFKKTVKTFWHCAAFFVHLEFSAIAPHDKVKIISATVSKPLVSNKQF